MDTDKDLVARLEALLFVYGDALAVKKAASVLGVSMDAVAAAAATLRTMLQERGSGLTLFEHDASLQLVTRTEYAGLLQEVLKAELHESLTPASLETLAIIAYAGPIARAEIDYIRGVNSSYTVRALALRGLVERENDERRANVYLYRPSSELLRHIGVTRVSELPDYERLRGVASQITQPTHAQSDVVKAPDAPMPA